MIKAILFRQLAIAKDGFVGIMAATSILTNIAKLSAYASDELLHSGQFSTMGWLVLAAILAALLGKKILQRISLRGFKTGVLAVLALAGTALLLGVGP